MSFDADCNFQEVTVGALCTLILLGANFAAGDTLIALSEVLDLFSRSSPANLMNI